MNRLFISIILLVLTACSSKPYFVKPAKEYTNTGKKKVYVVSHGWHTGFVIPSINIYSKLPKLNARFENSPYTEFGWGDKGFYQAKEITSGLALRAIFWPTESVIHVVAVPSNVYEYFPGSKIEEVFLTENGLKSLVSFISDSFYKDQKGEVLKLKNGIYGDSQFYKGVGDYYLMNTCNNWTAKGLKSAGMDISTTFKLTAGSVMNYLGQEKFR